MGRKAKTIRSTGSGRVRDDYLGGFVEGVTDRALGRMYCDGIGIPHKLTVCVPDLGTSRRAGYRNGWLER